MSNVLIQQYLNDLQDLRKVSGTTRESVVREAFKDLLKTWGRSHDLKFVPEYGIVTPAKDRRYVDGALLHALRMPFGYWEAKDEKDDLDAEIEYKLRRGYPQDNIIFEDSTQAVLIQNKHEVMRCPVEEVGSLEKLLNLFFAYERSEIAEFRTAVEQFKADLPDVLKALREMIESAYQDNPAFHAAADQFLKQAQESINPSLTEADVREILIQHILTEEIFALVFPGTNYHEDNNIARELYRLEQTFFTGNTKHQTLKALETYYASIRRAASQISSHHEKQTFLKVIYENFYKVYNPKAADRLGVVYTPNEIVRFMIESADWLCEQHFGRNLIDRDVEILDPAAGTGTFICELLEHFRGQSAKLKHKYLEELHANEVAILPYYVANLNIEATYAAISNEYLEYPNLCFVDTLDNIAGLRKYTGHVDDLFGSVSEENIVRIKRQNQRKISVIIGNPPYNANQANENDNNQNREYPAIDKRIKETYIKASTAQKTKLYDMYARFFRWASDRLHNDGVLALITNRSFIDSRTFDGFRKTVAAEFAEIYVIDLGGDWKRQDDPNASGGNVFGIGTGVAISLMVKKTGLPKATAPCRIRYLPMGNYAVLASEKLEWLGKSSFDALDFDEIRPDSQANWLHLTNNDFGTLIPVATKEAKRAKKDSQEKAIFKLFSLGIVTNRDEWVYDDDSEHLRKKVKFLIDTYNVDVARLVGVTDRKKIAALLDTTIKWTRSVKADLARSVIYNSEEGKIVTSLYRPFVKRELYFSRHLNEMLYQIPQLFGSQTGLNFAFCFAAEQRSEFGVIAFDQVPNKDVFMPSAAQVLALYRYENGNRIDNITDWALKQFEDHYKHSVTPAKAGVRQLSSAKAKALDSRLRGNDEQKSSGNDEQQPDEKGSGSRAITKETIFHYVYAVLHDPVYREKYALNLKREFPRIPFYPDFWYWVGWGRELMELHIGYETVEPWALKRNDVAMDGGVPVRRGHSKSLLAEAAGSTGNVKADAPKALLRADKDNGRILLDTQTTLTGVPPEAWDYKLGNRSALEWILDQYKEKKPKDPTIREKFNTYRFADYKEKVIDLLMRVTTVSVRTVAIVNAMKKAVR